MTTMVGLAFWGGISIYTGGLIHGTPTGLIKS